MTAFRVSTPAWRLATIAKGFKTPGGRGGFKSFVQTAPLPVIMETAAILKAKPSLKAQQKALLKIADHYEGKLRRAFIQAVNNVQDAASLKKLAEVVQTGSISKVMTALDLDAFSIELGAFSDEWQEGYIKSGVAAAQQAEDGTAGANVRFRFDPMNPRSAAFAGGYTYDLIQDVTKKTREAVGAIIESAMKVGKHPYQSAREIKQVVGLDARRAQALAGYRKALEEGSSRALALDIGGNAAASIRSAYYNDSMTQDKINKLVEGYRQRLLRQRAQTIARTESMRAASMGNREAWTQALEQTNQPLASFKRYWIATNDDRTRPDHLEIPVINADGVGMNEPFRLPDGGTIMFPHDPDAPPEQTINCRCTLAYEVADFEAPLPPLAAGSSILPVEVDKAFNPDQPRDDNGRWTSGGSGGAGKEGVEFTTWPRAKGSLHGVKHEGWFDAPQRVEDWAKVEGQNDKLIEPPLKKVHGKHPSAGVIIREKDGSVWLTKPAGGYGGYKHTWPKGTQDEGLSLQATAIKEAYEETGLKVRITGIAGDYERDTSVSRMYYAERVGGNPSDHGFESEAVVLVKPENLPKFLNRYVDQVIAHEKVGAPKPPPPPPKVDLGAAFKKPKGLFDWDGFLDANYKPWIKKDFNPDQPRGPDGKWIDAGGGGDYGGGLSIDDGMGGGNNVGGGKPSLPVKSLPKTSVVDTSSWPAHNSAAQWGAKKIAAMEGMTLAELQALDTTPKSASPNKYQKAVHAAREKLLNQKKNEAGFAAALPGLSDLKAGTVQNEGEPPKASTTTIIQPKTPAVIAATEPGHSANMLAHLKGKGVIVEVGDKWAANLSAENGWKQVGEKLGTNPGGIYQSKDGTKFYVKHQKSEEHASNEVLASKLYALAGSPAVEVGLAKTPDHAGVSTVAAMMETEPFNPNSETHKSAAKMNFATHVWLGNWDAAGATFDNQVIDKKSGAMTTIDVGGSMLFRAQGQPKGSAWSEDPTADWNNMRNPAINPNAAKIFGGMTESQLVESVSALAQIPDKEIRDTVMKLGPGSIKDREKLADTLIKRRDHLMGMVDPSVLDDDDLEPTKPQKRAPKAPDAVKVALPDFASKKLPVENTNAKSHNAKVEAIESLAKAGSAEPILAMGFGTNTYAKQQVKLANDALAALGSQEMVKPGQKKGEHPAVSGKAWAVQQATQADKLEAVHAGKGKFEPAKLPPPPDFANWEGTGKGLSSKAENNLANNQEVKALHTLALTGNLAQLQAYKPHSPSKHVGFYKDLLVQTMDEQLNPPEPLKVQNVHSLSSYKELSESFPGKPAGTPVSKVKTNEKVGYYIALGVAKTKEPMAWNHGSGPSTEMVEAPAKEQYKKLSAAAKAGVHAQQASTSSFASHFRSGNMGASIGGGVTVGDAYKAWHKEASALPAGTKLFRYIGLTADGKAKLLSAPPGIVLQDTSPMATSMRDGINSHFGQHKMELIALPGTRAIQSHGSGSHQGEKEITLVPGQRFIVHKIKKRSNGSLKIKAFLLPLE